MRWKVLEEESPRTFAVVFDKDDEAMAGLTAFARDNDVEGAQITAIGAFRRVVLGYFEPDQLDYKRFAVDEQVEVLSLVGDIALDGDTPAVHAHVVVGRSDGSTLGGHFFEGHVWPTLEVVVTDHPGHLTKRIDPDTGLALIDLGNDER